MTTARIIGLLVVLTLVSVFIVDIEHASGASPNHSVRVADGSNVDIIGSRKESRDGLSKSTGKLTHQSPSLQIRWLPDCPGNSANTGRIETCSGGQVGCADGNYRHRQWTAPPGTVFGRPGWTAGPVGCLGSDTAGAAPIVVTVQDFQRLPLPAGRSVVEPPGDYVLIRMPTNVYATSTEPVVLNTTVLGQPVEVRATPVAWSWDFGDGAVIGPSDDPGAASPRLTHTHEYQARGTYRIVMTTHYRGEFRVPGGQWQPVVGRAQVAGAPKTVTALAGRARLLADAG